MKLTMLDLQHEEDYPRVLDYLRKISLLIEGKELHWQVYRLDHWCWRGCSTLRLARRMVSFPVDPVLPTQSEVHDTIE